MKTAAFVLAFTLAVPAAAFAQKTPVKDIKPPLVDCPSTLSVAVSEKVAGSVPPGWKLGPDPVAAVTHLESVTLIQGSRGLKGGTVACKYENVRAPLVTELPADCLPKTIGPWTNLGRPFVVSTAPRQNDSPICSVKLATASTSAGAGRPACQVTCESPSTSARPN